MRGRKRKPPLTCKLCGIAMWNDENARWTITKDPEPFCSDWCMAADAREREWPRERP